MVKAAGKSSISARKSEATKTAKKTTKTAVKTTKKKATSTKKTRTSAQKTAEKAEKTEKNEAVSNEARRKRLIRNEVRRLSDTFKEIPSEKKRLVKATIDDVAFLSVSMQPCIFGKSELLPISSATCASICLFSCVILLSLR